MSVVFNANNPKYRSCCCGAHVTKVSKIIMILTVIGSIFDIFQHLAEVNYSIGFLVVGLPLLCFGVYGVFKEKRTPLLIYVVTCMIGSGFLVLCLMFAAIYVDQMPELREQGHTSGTILFSSALFVLIACFVYSTLLSLAEFIKDRDLALPSLQYVRIDRPVLVAKPGPVPRHTVAAPATVPSAPVFIPAHIPCASDAPPPYDEKNMS